MNKKLLLTFIFFMFVTTLLTILAFTYHSRASTTPNLYIQPASTTIATGTYVYIDINIANVTQLAAWQLKLYYRNTVLNGTLTIEGPFLKQGGPTFYWQVQLSDNYNGTHGLVELACTIFGNTNGVNGSGTLATVVFKSIAKGSTSLHLEDTKLGDSSIPPNPIPHTTADGVVVVESHDVAVKKVTPLKNVVGQNLTMRIATVAENQGDFTETFNVTAYANTTQIAIQEVTLNPGENTTITYMWSTMGIPKGNYIISASATQVQYETDTADNTRTNGTVLVTIIGDVNGDRIVDISDLVLVIAYTPSKSGSGPPDYKEWYPNMDINNDLIVDISDIILVISHVGESDP